ncbi:hypothetical protein J8273_6982 [Carpediemonas membranifera]|uniref:Uncharacterized protein n=1 Tax=Carpediemonas membranifera TaxID=201153 RepID=A0A8J6DXP5_9EUKA|nr:hypothetical protein J8273_6982 [Carpediemonas membranifera]|eukprot:KAG9390729.1 hypothetical protein J8273_6982 [Carpediemonas membranifera]
MPLQRIFDAIEQGHLHQASVYMDVVKCRQVLGLVAFCQFALAGVVSHLKIRLRPTLTDGDIVSAALQSGDISLTGNGRYSAGLVAAVRAAANVGSDTTARGYLNRLMILVFSPDNFRVALFGISRGIGAPIAFWAMLVDELCRDGHLPAIGDEIHWEPLQVSDPDRYYTVTCVVRHEFLKTTRGPGTFALILQYEGYSGLSIVWLNADLCLVRCVRDYLAEHDLERHADASWLVELTDTEELS